MQLECPSRVGEKSQPRLPRSEFRSIMERSIEYRAENGPEYVAFVLNFQRCTPEMELTGRHHKVSPAGCSVGCSLQLNPQMPPEKSKSDTLGL